MTVYLSQIFNEVLHEVSQSLLIPVMIILALFLIYSIISLGILLAEYYNRKKPKIDFKYLLGQILSLNIQNKENKSDRIIELINSSDMSSDHKKVLSNLAITSNISPEFRESIAFKMVEDETIKVAKKLEKTDIIAKIAPAIGLMGTLIPLGPGLTALGSGDIQNLSQNLILAFDAAILGMAAASIAFTISKIRRRWYEEDISNLESLAESVLEVLKF
jgi:biopolymer transport protein ExbB/TolQ